MKKSLTSLFALAFALMFGLVHVASAEKHMAPATGTEAAEPAEQASMEAKKEVKAAKKEKKMKKKTAKKMKKEEMKEGAPAK